MPGQVHNGKYTTESAESGAMITAYGKAFLSSQIHITEAPQMASGRCTDVEVPPHGVPDVTSFDARRVSAALVPPFRAAFHAPMAAWRLDGQPGPRAGLRTGQSTAPERRRRCGLFFLLVSLKTSASQVCKGACLV